ncbi:MAG TPA: 16S rRNA (guanine(966)-N(2))-methyltransferase RsmD [Vicinamibacterales bacterium]|nr:16S rRNA (guanine(966)-N(2))-methyltransferase RsmD [Vicinamibacterales bacterium]
MRIIAGEFKGRRLHAPTWDGLRPTSDKLRETLFNVVAQRVPGARVLDLYAGTGAIGIEALSRGAAHVTFVDHDPRALKLIEQNLRHCGVADRYAIIRFCLVPRAAREDAPPMLPAGSFDLIVLDPPYDEPDLTASIASAEPLVAPDGLLVLEHAKRKPAPERVERLSRTRDLVSGDSALAFYVSQT